MHAQRAATLPGLCMKTMRMYKNYTQPHEWRMKIEQVKRYRPAPPPAGTARRKEDSHAYE